MQNNHKAWISVFATRLAQLPRKTKRLIMIAADAVMVPLALLCAFALRFAEPFYISRFELSANEALDGLEDVLGR